MSVDIEKIRNFFKGDLFANNMGIVIEEVGDKEAVCTLEVDENFMNAAGMVQGGAIFTLADYTFAVASNSGGSLTVSLNSYISFMKPGKGKKLTAISKLKSESKKTCFYETVVTDEDGTVISIVNATGFIKGTEIKF